MVSVIIVNYNTSEILERSLESVKRVEGNMEYEIIVVDNCSDEINSSKLDSLSSLYPSVKFIRLKEKVSFSEANNIGVKSATKKEYLLIMNPDIIFSEPLFDKLINVISCNKSIGAVTPLLIGEDNKFQYSYFQRYPTIMRFICFISVFAKLFDKKKYFQNKYLMNLDINTESDEMQFVEQIPCAFFFTTYSIFMEIGMMDTSYELFFEDVDLCYRYNKKYKLAVIPKMKVHHLSGVSFSVPDNWWMYGRFVTSMIIFFRLHKSKLSFVSLKFIARMNSRLILFSELMKSPSKASLNHRYKKHKYLLDLLKED
ncbi:MAG: glycosyltransferase family 2 protein [Ignavibacteriae bacterium]|nr:glycosyltransferase family 2 protein [Ignavibacteriota bacterium]